MADSFVPQLDACLRFETFCVHCRFHLVRIEDEHTAFFPPLSYDSAIFLDETTFVVEADLHALLHDLADRDQILRYCGHVQDILDASLLAFFPEWDIADVPNRVRSVVSRLYETGSVRCMQITNPLFAGCHVM